MGLPNPPVTQIFLIGPKEKGMCLAKDIFAICKDRGWVPAIFVSEHLTEKIRKQITYPIQRNGVVTFGEESKQVYEEMCSCEVPVKVIRLLGPQEPAPDHIFSYHAQIWKDTEEVSLIVSWMGIIPWLKRSYFCQGVPGSLIPEELEP